MDPIEEIIKYLVKEKSNSSTRAIRLITHYHYGVGQETINALNRAIIQTIRKGIRNGVRF